MDDSHVPNPISEQLALHFVCRFQAPLDVWSLLAKHYPESSELADGMGRCQVGDVSRPWNLLTKNHVRQPESSAFCRRSVRKVCEPLRRNKFKTVQSRFNLPVLDSRFFSNDKRHSHLSLKDYNKRTRPSTTLLRNQIKKQYNHHYRLNYEVLSQSPTRY